MRRVSLLLSLLLITGCASQPSRTPSLLAAPAGTKPTIAAHFEQGSALFHSRDYGGAEQAFRQAIAAEPTLAEAHYNLAVALDQQGQQVEAKKHYLEAANLAPGNKVIWDSPPLRQQTGGLNYNIGKKSYQDPSYKGF